MAELTDIECKRLERLLGMRTGYVLDFSDSSYESFFREFGIDIERQAYRKYGRSKVKRMRAFWDHASEHDVGRILEGLLEYIEAMQPQNCGGQAEQRHWNIVNRLLGGGPHVAREGARNEQRLELTS